MGRSMNDDGWILPAIDAVLFDVGGVLIGPSAAAVSDIFRESTGSDVPPPRVVRSFALADRAAEQAGPSMSDARTWARHWSLAMAVDEAVGAGVHQLIHGDPELTSRVWSEVDPRAAGALRRLRRGGLLIGLVSQSDGQLGARLVRAGLAHLVDTVVDSGHVPWDKPHPAIYRHAAALVGVPLSRCAFLGDVLYDVRGAVRAGCTNAYLYDPHEVWADVDHPRTTSLHAFVDIVLGKRAHTGPTLPHPRAVPEPEPHGHHQHHREQPRHQTERVRQRLAADHAD